MNKQQLNEEILKDIPAFMNRMFGKDQWVYDEVERVYIARDPKYTGEDFGFIAVSQDGSWFNGVRPFEQVVSSIMSGAVRDLAKIGIRSAGSVSRLNQGVAIGLHIGQTEQCAVAGKVASEWGARFSVAADSADQFAEEVANILANSAIYKAASNPTR